MIDGKAAGDINVRADSYLIARTVGLCPHCGSETPLVALMMPPGHETSSLADERACESRDFWERAPLRAFLFYVESLPDTARHHLQRLAPAYRLAVSPATQDCYWANHCERCGRLQEDHDLFCEPQGAFLPVSPAAAAAIELLPIDEPMEAGAAGYALDPALLGCARGA